MRDSSCCACFRGRRLHPVAMVVLACLLPSAEVAAQAPTAFVEPSNADSVRAIGLAGAFIGLADDSSTTIRNPAGLSRVPRSLEALAGALVSSDDGRAFGSAGLRPTRRWAFGAQLAKPPVGMAHAMRGVPQGSVRQSEAKVTDFAAGVAFLMGGQGEFSAGASVQLRKLSVDAFTPDDDYAASFTLGVLFRPVNPWSPRLGLSYRHKTDWDVTVGDDVSQHVRGVSIVSAGASWYYEPEHWFRLSISLQPDLVLYSQLRGEGPWPVEAHDDVDLRAGAEATIPFGCWTGCGSMIQLRVGLLNSAALPFAAPSAPDRAGANDLDRRRTSWSAGAAVALRQVLQGRLKLEAAYDRRSETLAFALGYRFPETFRAEIVDTTPR